MDFADTMNAQQFLAIVSNRRFRAFAIGILALAILAVLQVNNLKRYQPMCELLSNCKLQHDDLHRMSGLLGEQGGHGVVIKRELAAKAPTDLHWHYLHM